VPVLNLAKVHVLVPVPQVFRPTVAQRVRHLLALWLRMLSVATCFAKQIPLCQQQITFLMATSLHVENQESLHQCKVCIVRTHQQIAAMKVAIILRCSAVQMHFTIVSRIGPA
jgi:hypothetical protein